MKLGFLNEAPGSRGPAIFETGFGGNGIKASYGVPELRNEASLSREILPWPWDSLNHPGPQNFPGIPYISRDHPLFSESPRIPSLVKLAYWSPPPLLILSRCFESLATHCLSCMSIVVCEGLKKLILSQIPWVTYHNCYRKYPHHVRNLRS